MADKLQQGANAHAMWYPSTTDIEASEMYRFMQWFSQREDGDFANYETLHAYSVEHPDRFWRAIWQFFDVQGDSGNVALENPAEMPRAQWFTDGRLNFAENLLRYADITPDAIALTECNEHGSNRAMTYAELRTEVSQLAATFRDLGVAVGDRVAAMSTNSHHAIVAMLACSAIGAVWSSCSPDFGESGILDRFAQIEPTLFIGCARYQYAGKQIDCLEKITKVCAALDSLRASIVFDPLSSNAGEYSFNDSEHNAHANRDIPRIQWEDALASTPTSEAPELDYARLPFNAPLYILFSSGTTGKPKCIVHGVGGTLLQHLKELSLHTDVKHETRLFYFTTCGWMMWNWYVSGLALGASLMVYDGSPFHPEKSALFDLAQQEKIEVFGVSAKYLAACQKFNLTPRYTHDLGKVKSILSTGSPLLPESFDYVYQDVSTAARVSSISGGTDIVSCFALGNPMLPVFRGELQCAGLGMDIAFYDDSGNALESGKGELSCRTPFPSMPIYFWNDTCGERYHKAYFARFDQCWAHGDFGEFFTHKLSDGSQQTGVMIHGRSDAVLNPNGVRIGTAEIYRQVEKIDAVFESLAVGQKYDGDERIILFVHLKNGHTLDGALTEKIKTTIRDNTSPRHVPAIIIQVYDIPRTRSGKIVELAVRSVIHGEHVKNTEALANPEALDQFKDLKQLEV